MGAKGRRPQTHCLSPHFVNLPRSDSSRPTIISKAAPACPIGDVHLCDFPFKKALILLSITCRSAMSASRVKKGRRPEIEALFALSNLVCATLAYERLSGKAIAMRRGYSRKPDSESQVSGQTVIDRINRRGRTQSNLWIFESPKNSKRLSINGDLNFMLCVLLEGDTSVAGYKVAPGPYHIAIDGVSTSVVPDLEIERQTGPIEWWEVKRSQAKKHKNGAPPSTLARASEITGSLYCDRNDKHVAGKAIAFDNWLLLCAAMTRARHFATHREASVLRRHLSDTGKVSVRELLADSTIDRALMIATVARFLQAGRATADLDNMFFTEDTILTARSV